MFRSHAQANFAQQTIDVAIGYRDQDGRFFAATGDTRLVYTQVDQAIVTPVALRLSEDEARALYEALGQALGHATRRQLVHPAS